MYIGAGYRPSDLGPADRRGYSCTGHGVTLHSLHRPVHPYPQPYWLLRTGRGESCPSLPVTDAPPPYRKIASLREHQTCQRSLIEVPHPHLLRARARRLLRLSGAERQRAQRLLSSEPPSWARHTRHRTPDGGRDVRRPGPGGDRDSASDRHTCTDTIAHTGALARAGGA